MAGLVGYGAYIPYWRLQRGAITAALGSGGGKGLRSVASFDEDTTSLGVEAGRNALAMAPERYAPPPSTPRSASTARLRRTTRSAPPAAVWRRCRSSPPRVAWRSCPTSAPAC